MESLTEFFRLGGGAQPSLGFESVLLHLLLAFVLGQLAAWTYVVTHTGLSYSRSFVQSLVLLSVTVAMVMLVIGNSVVTAVGLLGALAIIRFRNVLKDTRDTAFLFLALALGMGVGAGRYEVAILGTVVLCLAAFFLRLTGFGTRHHHDGFLRFRVTGEGAGVEPILRRHCRGTTLVSRRIAKPEGGRELAFRLTLRDPDRSEELVEELTAQEGVEGVSLVLQEDQMEI